MWIRGFDSGNSGGHRAEESVLLVLPCHEVVERHGKAVNEVSPTVAAPHPHFIVFLVDVVVRDCNVEYLGEFSYYLLDLDSDGGFVVTPDDLYHSDLLELVQIYGIPPNY